MNSTDVNQSELNQPLELLNFHLDGRELSPAEIAQLETWIAAAPENATLVAELGMLHECIDSALSVPRLLERISAKNPPAVNHALERAIRNVELAAATTPVAPTPRSKHPLATWLAVAACLALLALPLSQLVRTREAVRETSAQVTTNPVKPAEPVAPAPVIAATTIEALDAVDGAGRILHRGLALAEGERLSLSRGVLHLTTASGSDVVVEAPSTFQFTAADRVSLPIGKLTTRIGEQTTSFEVTTPSAVVIDRGTEFGVAVSDELDTHVAVYDGIVDLAGKNKTSFKRLTAGRAGFVSADGELRSTVETNPNLREFIRSDEIAALRAARDGSEEAQGKVTFFQLQRIEGLCGFQSFDIPSNSAAQAIGFRTGGLRSKLRPQYEADLVADRLYSSGALRVTGASGPVFLDIDVANESPLARAGLVGDRGLVGRSGTELWLAWRTRAIEDRPGAGYAGISLMFGDEQLVQEPLLFGTWGGKSTLKAVANLGSSSQEQVLDADPTSFRVDDRPAGTDVHQWVVRIVFAERSDRIAVWCDPGDRDLAQVRPNVEFTHNEVAFDRLRFGVGANSGDWLFDNVLLATHFSAIQDAQQALAP